MEDEARWLSDQNPSVEKEAPNFLDSIYMNGLDMIKPDTVNIIH